MGGEPWKLVRVSSLLVLCVYCMRCMCTVQLCGLPWCGGRGVAASPAEGEPRIEPGHRIRGVDLLCVPRPVRRRGIGQECRAAGEAVPRGGSGRGVARARFVFDTHP